ncbi:hypothetical protein [uncultured Umboniibacter sp.]|nr:hypothetical protein [uncultured Umboniibacter sp.]
MAMVIKHRLKVTTRAVSALLSAFGAVFLIAANAVGIHFLWINFILAA